MTGSAPLPPAPAVLLAPPEPLEPACAERFELPALPPPPELAPSCAEGGVLGVLPGIIGSLQASEALKLIVDAGQTLTGRLLLFDALHTTFDEVSVKKDPGCPVCGDAPTITDYVDYVEFCSGALSGAPHEQRPVHV